MIEIFITTLFILFIVISRPFSFLRSNTKLDCANYGLVSGSIAQYLMGFYRAEQHDYKHLVTDAHCQGYPLVGQFRGCKSIRYYEGGLQLPRYERFLPLTGLPHQPNKHSFIPTPSVRWDPPPVCSCSPLVQQRAKVLSHDPGRITCPSVLPTLIYLWHSLRIPLRPSNSLTKHAISHLHSIMGSSIELAESDDGLHQTDDIQFRGLRAVKVRLTKRLFNVLMRWIITLAIVVAIFAVLIFYSESMRIMLPSTKREFNAIITGLLIALGLSIAMSLSVIISNLRWWILSRRYFSYRKVDLILQSDGLWPVITLALKTRRIGIHSAALFLVVLLLGTQILLSVIGLCYSVGDADKEALLVKPGNISIPDMSSIQTVKTVKSNSTSRDAVDFTANSYGQMSLAYEMAGLEDIPREGRTWSPSEPLVFCGPERCEYVFHEAPATVPGNSDSKSLTVTTSRRVNTTAVCKSWPVTAGGDGTEETISFVTETGPRTAFIPIRGGMNQTTFVTNTTTSCGSGCMTVSALEVSNPSSWYYTCNITVGTVQNATRSEHQVGATLRTAAAAGIALQGYEVSSLVNDTTIQYHTYPAESVFGVPLQGSPENMAMVVTRFAIGTIAAAAENNDDIVIDGIVPIKGNQLKVEHWGYVSMILGFLAILQIALELAAVFATRHVVIPTGGPLATSQVLRSMIAQRSSVMGDALRIKASGDATRSRWIYRSVLVSRDGVYDLYMEGGE